MRAVFSPRPTAPRSSALFRSLAVAVVFSSAIALAQAPANDECINAEVIPSAGPFPYWSSTINVVGASDAGTDPSMSCATTTRARTTWWKFTPAISGTYVIQRCSEQPMTTGTNLSTTNAIAVFTSAGACTSFTQVASACVSTSCPSSTSALNVALTAGTDYYLMDALTSTTAPNAVTANLQLRINKLDTPPSNDVCGVAQPLTTDRPLETFTIGGVNDYQLDGGSACFTGLGQTSSSGTGRDVAYRFTAPADGQYSIRIRGTLANFVLYTSDACIPGPSPSLVSCQAAANRQTSTASTTPAGEELSCITMATGNTLYVYVDEGTASTSGAPFDVEVSACNREIEPNNTPAQAQPLSCGVTGAINPATEADFYSLGSPPIGSRVFTMVDAVSSANQDLDVRVTTDVDTLECDDTNNDVLFGSLSGNIAGRALTGVQSYVRVSYFGSSGGLADPYRLYTVVQPPSSSATVEVEPNDTLATASSSSTNYFTGTLPDAGTTITSQDVDFYAFQAAAGDLVFVSVDEDPTRDNSYIVARVSLLDSSGAYLITSNDTGTGGSTTSGAGSLSSTTPNSLGEALTYRIRTTGTYYVRIAAGSSSSTTAGDYILSISRNCVPGSPPLVFSATALNPNSGPSGGGTVVDITGANFEVGATVTFGGVAATQVSWVNRYLLRATTPAGMPGTVPVVVTNPDSTVSAPLDFTYNAVPPTVTAVSPSSGPTAGGTTVTVTGRNFLPGAEVTVGGAQCTSLVVASATRISCVTPAGSFGAADVIATNPGGLVGPALTGGYLYVDIPTITAVNPASGIAAGGTTVTITGSNFAVVTTVKFDTTPATNVTLVNSTTLTARAPAHAAGLVDVTVTNPGPSTATLPLAYEYIAPPALTALNPTFGPSNGGTTVTLTGTGFASGATVRFGTVAATSVNFVDATTLTATAPAGTGTVNVTVTNPDTQVSNTQPYVYTPPPSVTAVAPIGGPVGGGTDITITGTNFQPGSTVTIGGAAATNVVAATATTITATTPAGTAGNAPVVVNTPDGQTSNATVLFRYGDAPAVTAISPQTGPFVGGQLVTITGTGFFAGATVTIGGFPATSVTVVNATTITARTPAGMATGVTVTVTNADTQTGSLPMAYSYVPGPSVTMVTPSSGFSSGGTNITITGSDFITGATVSIGGAAATNVVFVSSTSITATTPPGVQSGVPVSVRNPDGQIGTLPMAFTYVLPPSITSVTPPSGPVAGGTMLTLTGSAFQTGATVTIGGAMATNVMVVSPATITLTTPPGAAGAAAITVTNPDTQTVTLTGRFTYVAGPTLTMLAPDLGALQGGTVVTLTGTGFRAGATVTFGGNAATSIAITSATSATATTPAGTGTVDVVLTNVDGQSATLPQAFTYVPAPTVSSLSPSSGPEAGGTMVTITGDGFGAGTTATLGGTPVGNLLVMNAMTITGTTPAHLPGSVDLVVTGRDGRSARLAGAFTYVAEIDAGSTGGGAGGGSGGSGGGSAGGSAGGAGGGTSGTGGGTSGTGGGTTGTGGGGTTEAPKGCGCGTTDAPLFAFALLGLLIFRRRSVR